MLKGLPLSMSVRLLRGLSVFMELFAAPSAYMISARSAIEDSSEAGMFPEVMFPVDALRGAIRVGTGIGGDGFCSAR